MRTPYRWLLVVVLLLAVASVTARTATAKVPFPPPPLEAIDPGDPDDNGTNKYVRDGLSPLSGPSPIAVRRATSETPIPPESGTRESSPAQADGRSWRLEKILMVLLFRLPLGR